MLITTCALFAISQLPDVETRTLLTGPKGAPDTEILMTQRIATRDGFILITKSLLPDVNVAYNVSTFDKRGVPILTRQEGQWDDRWNIFETKYGNKKCVQSINGEVTNHPLDPKIYMDSPKLWFWKVHPKVGTNVTVKILSQNTISTSRIKYTFEGDEEMKLAGRKVKVHRVRETPLDSAPGVYTICWYDQQGMGVQRYHKTTRGEFRCDLLAWR